MTFLSSENKYIDLRGTPCPLNFVRCCLAIDELSANDYFEVMLDRGEPEEMVVTGLKNKGHDVQIVEKNDNWLKLMVVCGES